MDDRILGNGIRLSQEMESRIRELLKTSLKETLDEQEKQRVSEKPKPQGHAGISIAIAVHLLAAAIWYFGVMPAINYALTPITKTERDISIEQPKLSGR